MLVTVLTVVHCDGSPTAALAVHDALAAVLTAHATPSDQDRGGNRHRTGELGRRQDRHGSAGGAPVLPVPAGEAGTRLAEELRADEPAAAGTALVVATSGSTGRAKGVELSGSALVASANATHDRLGGPGHWLLALPAQHVAGAQVLVRSVLAGRAPTILDLRPGFTAEAFAAAAAAMPQGRRYTSLVPTQLLRILDAADPDGPVELRRFDAVLVGGAACPAALLRRAEGAGVRVVTTYGMSETAGGCVYDGLPLDGVRVRLTDGGRIELAGPTLATGYRLGSAQESAAATATAFRDGWFRTDDAGAVTGVGMLEVLGRVDDVIVTGGRKVAPALVERALSTVAGVGEVCVVGVPDDEWGELVAAAVVARDPSRPPDPAALRGAARDLAGPAAGPKLIRVVTALPLRGPGKVDRAEVRRLLSGGR